MFGDKRLSENLKLLTVPLFSGDLDRLLENMLLLFLEEKERERFFEGKNDKYKFYIKADEDENETLGGETFLTILDECISTESLSFLSSCAARSRSNLSLVNCLFILSFSVSYSTIFVRNELISLF